MCETINHLLLICPLSSRQVKYLKLDVDDACIFKEIQCNGKLSMYELFSKYHKIFAYFDDWVFIKSDDVYKDITEILVKKKGDAHLETCTW